MLLISEEKTSTTGLTVYLIQQYEKKTSTEVSKDLWALKNLKPEVEKDVHVKKEAINEVILNLVFNSS
jgi:hypothetical protein